MYMYRILLLFGVLLCGEAHEESGNDIQHVGDVISYKKTGTTSRPRHHRIRHSLHGKECRGKGKTGNENSKANKNICNCPLDDHISRYNAVSSTIFSENNAETGTDMENKTFIKRTEQQYKKMECTTLCRLHKDFEYNLSRSMDGVSDGSNVAHIADNVGHTNSSETYKDNTEKQYSNIVVLMILVIALSLITIGLAAGTRHAVIRNKRMLTKPRENAIEEEIVPYITPKRTNNVYTYIQKPIYSTVYELDIIARADEPDGTHSPLISRGMKYTHESTEQNPLLGKLNCERDGYKSVQDGRYSEQGGHNSEQSGRNSKEYGRNCGLDGWTKPSVNNMSDEQVTDSDIVCMEREAVSVVDVKVSIVKPLKSPDPKSHEDTAPVLLDWDKIFLFLVGNLPASNYILFFNVLFGNCQQYTTSGIAISSYVNHIEHNVRKSGNGIQTVIFELFRQWKQLMGRDASTACIDTSLKEMGYNDVAEQLEEFMKNPPVLPTHQGATGCQAICPNEMKYTDKPTSKSIAFVPPSLPYSSIFMVHGTPQPYNQVAHTRGAEAALIGPIIQEVPDEHLQEASPLRSLCRELPLASGSKSTLFANSLSHEKRKRRMYVSDVHQEEMQLELSRRKQKKMEIMHTVKSSSFESRFRNEDPTYYDEMKQCIINQAMRFLPMSIIPLETKEYDIFLEHIIDCILKDTGESRDTVLLLRHRNFRDIEEFETKKKDKLYFIYSCNTCLILRQPQYEKLELYVKYARHNLLQKFKATTGDDFREPEALFITRDCQPVLRKRPIARARRASSNIIQNRSSSDTDMDATSDSEASSNSSTENINTLGMRVLADTTSTVQEIKTHSKTDNSTNEINSRDHKAYFRKTVNTTSDTGYSQILSNRELNTKHNSDHSEGNQTERENGVVKTSDNETQTSQLVHSIDIPVRLSFAKTSNYLEYTMGQYENSNFNENKTFKNKPDSDACGNDRKSKVLIKPMKRCMNNTEIRNRCNSAHGEKQGTGSSTKLCANKSTKRNHLPLKTEHLAISGNGGANEETESKTLVNTKTNGSCRFTGTSNESNNEFLCTFGSVFVCALVVGQAFVQRDIKQKDVLSSKCTDNVIHLD